MNKSFTKVIFSFLPAVFMLIGYLYILLGIQPELIFHHNQPAFIVSSVYINPFFKYPGGLAELSANLISQSFYFKVFGAGVFFALAFVTGCLTLLIINSINKSKLNRFWAFLPVICTITLANDYNFPLAVVVSIAFLLLMLLALQKWGNNFISSILIYTTGAVAVYWFAGSGYLMLFSMSALFVSRTKKQWEKVVYLLYIPAFAFLFPLLVSNYLIALTLKDQFFYFFPKNRWIVQYEPSKVFTIYLLLTPILPATVQISAFFQSGRKKTDPQKPVYLYIKTMSAIIIVLVFSVFGHYLTYDHDAKKTIQADFYCYKNDAENTAKTATSTYKYDFSANLNYNLAMSKTGQLNSRFFDFIQIKGTEALHPDIEFDSELSFISSDFYYNLGFISEARHWAYESLVFYPYSLRAMQNLVKIHLVAGEYKAAEKTLKTLAKGFIDRDFVREYMQYVADTLLIKSNGELMEKRSLIPAERELNRTIEGRFKELLEANSRNKKAFEFLMLYYLADADLENFAELFKDAENYFEEIPSVYEEGLLMYAGRTGKTLPSEIKISAETQKRYNSFMQQLEKYKGKTRLARNSLYPEFGNTYMYFLKFVYPNIIETEIISNEDDYPAI
ncbi:MAG TPA: DUF6057 family protein [Draconibacterium sp.]|nr:DUF6057 family protein [Draconibacterium sp.]